MSDTTVVEPTEAEPTWVPPHEQTIKLLRAENANLRRELDLRKAGVDPHSPLGDLLAVVWKRGMGADFFRRELARISKAQP